MIKGIQTELEPMLTESNGSVGLYLSGGSDSLLLLHILLDMKAKFDVVTFDHTFTREQRQAVDDLLYQFELKGFSYPPANMYLIGDGKTKVTLVEEYATLSGWTIPFLRDCEQNDWKCVYDANLKGNLLPTAPLGFKLSLFGTRKYDRHYSLGRLLRKKTWVQGPLTYHTPLYDLTRADVKAGLAHFGVKPPKLDTGSVPLCTKCLTATENVACPKSPGSVVAPFQWEPTVMLDSFRNKYAGPAT